MNKQIEFNDKVIKRMDEIENTQDRIVGVIGIATLGAIVAIPCLAIGAIVKAVKKHSCKCSDNVKETDLEDIEIDQVDDLD